MTRAIELLLSVIAFVIVGLWGPPAVASPAKVALTIEGDSSSIGIRKAVVGAFSEDDLEFVSAKETTRAIEKMGIGEVTSASQAKTVAKRLEADAVVQGAFDESALTLTLTIYDSGKSSSFTLPAGNAKSERFQKALRKKMLARIAAISDDEADSDDDEAPAKESKKSAKQEKAEKAKLAKEEKAEKARLAKEEKAEKAKLAKEEKAEKAKLAKEEKAEKAKLAKEEKAEKAKLAKEEKEKAKLAKQEKADNEKVAIKDDEEDEEPAKTTKAAAKDDDEEEEPAAPTKVASKDDEEDDEESDDEGEDEEEPPGGASIATNTTVSPRVGANLAAIRIDLGASVMGRSLKFTTSAVEGAPAAYRAKPTPGGHVAAEIYPAAVSNRSRLIAGLGLAGEFDQATSFTAPATDGTKLKVAERQYSVGVRFRLAFGHRPTSPTVTVGAGYGVRTFAVDHSSGMPTGVPDVNYRMVDPGLTLRVPVGRRVALFAGGRGLLLLSAGPIAEAQQYGRAQVKGGTATAGVDIIINRYLAVRIAGEGTQLDMKFAGQGMLSNLDADPTTNDVQAARDRYYGGQATLGVMY